MTKEEMYKNALLEIIEIGFKRADEETVDYSFSKEGHSKCIDIALDSLNS